jgi:hypothetical protein
MNDWILNWQVKEPGLYDVCDEGPHVKPNTWWSNIPVFIHRFNHGDFLAIQHVNDVPVQISNLNGWIFRKVLP